MKMATSEAAVGATVGARCRMANDTWSAWMLSSLLDSKRTSIFENVHSL